MREREGEYNSEGDIRGALSSTYSTRDPQNGQAIPIEYSNLV